MKFILVQFVLIPCFEKYKLYFIMLLSVIVVMSCFCLAFTFTSEYTKSFLRLCGTNQLDSPVHSCRLMWMEFSKEYLIYKSSDTAILTVSIKSVLSVKDLTIVIFRHICKANTVLLGSSRLFACLHGTV